MLERVRSFEEERRRQERMETWQAREDAVRNGRIVLGVLSAAMLAAFVAVAAVTLFWAPAADAATITVNPWQTIASGISAAVSGDTVVVNAGNYTGNVNPKTGVTVRASGVVNVAGGTNLTCNNCAVIGFRFDHGSAWMKGNDILLEGNRFNGKGGGEDYAGVFGDRITVRGNFFYGVRIPEDLKPVAGGWEHNDVIQFWNNNGEVLHDLLIEGNIFTDYVQGVFLANETGNLASMARLTIRNNVFWGTDFIESQNLIGGPSHGLFVGKANITGVSITNNLFFNNANCVSLYMAQAAIVQGNIILNGGTAYAVGDGGGAASFSRGTVGNVLWANGWNGYPAQGPDKYINPQLANPAALGVTILGPDGLMFTADDAWRPTNALAAGYGPSLGGVPAPANTAPRITISGPTAPLQLASGEISKSFTLTATASDAEGPVTLRWTGGGTSTATSVTLSQGVGTASYGCTATDTGGLTATATFSVTVLAAPVVPPPPPVVDMATQAELDAAVSALTAAMNAANALRVSETAALSARVSSLEARPTWTRAQIEQVMRDLLPVLRVVAP